MSFSEGTRVETAPGDLGGDRNWSVIGSKVEIIKKFVKSAKTSIDLPNF